MALNRDPEDIYRAIGVTPIINASGSTTAYGGSKLRPEVQGAMNSASGVMVNIGELNQAAGRIIAEELDDSGYLIQPTDHLPYAPGIWYSLEGTCPACPTAACFIQARSGRTSLSSRAMRRRSG